MREERKGPEWSLSAEQMAGGLVDGYAEGVKQAGKMMLRGKPFVTRYVLQKIPGLPGVALKVGQYATAKDKARAGTEIAGGLIGGALGMVAGPVSSVVGSVVGEKAGELIYDHRDDIKAWMKARNEEVVRNAANELQR